MTRTTTAAEHETGPATGLRADARRNHERLLRAADEVFAEHGPDASLDEIAKRAGVGIGTLYRRFPTREVLQEAVMRGAIDRLRLRAEELLDAPSPIGGLSEWLDELLLHATTYRGLTATMMMTLLKQEPDFSAACHAMASAVAELVARAQAAGEVRADAEPMDVLKLVNAIGIATEPGPAGLARGRRMLAVTIDGLRARRPG